MSPDPYVVRIEKQEPIASLILCNPRRLNAMGSTFAEDLRNAFETLDRDDTVRAIVLKAEGRAFCAGLDLAAFASQDPELMAIPAPASSKPKMLAMIRRFQEAISSAEACRKPVIAAIQGWCIGGGLDLIAACDIRLASRDAVFSLREAKVGILADLGSLQRLPRIIGEGWTRQLAFTAEDLNAEKALHIGLLNGLFETVDETWAEAEAMARRIAANAPLAVQAAKEVLNWNRGRPVAESLEYVAARNTALLPSEDLLEALGAFLEKREPRFQGR